LLIGHYAPALALKRATPGIPLWVLFVSTQFLDLLWGPFILLGVEHCRIVPHFTQSNDLDLYDMPWSHSLAMAIVWSCACGGLAAWLRPRWGARGRVFVVIALAVFSHWIADFIVHVSDLPLAPGAAKVGLGLWRSLPAALFVETGILILGLLIVPKMPRMWMLWAFLPPVALVTFFIPTPPSPAAMAMTGFATYVLYAFIAYRAERPYPST
jgi:membrane-bound metal-dependent hydrolase YbcI (DUF457 family)